MTADIATGADIRIDAPLTEEASSSLADDVLDGLTRPFKQLPPKHLYDARGSELFEQICELPEYYPTRCERQILTQRAEEIVARAQPAELVELGSGAADKARVLLNAMRAAGRPLRYVPVDVSESALRGSAEHLCLEYPGLSVHGVVGDFERHLDHLPDAPAAGRGGRLVAFLGGTIGNFTPGTRRGFLRRVGATLDRADRLLLGCDLVKEPAVLEAAYNDASGVTAAFNRNVLEVVNRELAGDFDPGAFAHVAFFDREREWIEMRLRADAAQTVRIAQLDLEVRFAAREELLTEISTKFTPERLEADLAAGGLALEAMWTDADGLFALALARPAR